MIENTYTYLSAVLGYPLHIPDAPTTKAHRIGFAGVDRYVPPKPRELPHQEAKTKDTLSGSKKIILNIIKRQNRPVPASVVEKKTQFTRNHCSIIMAELYKLGFVTRKKYHSNGTRMYLYEAKDKT